MHFDIPEKLTTSIKEFLSHYVMIVVSIFSALVAEHFANYIFNVNNAKLYAKQIEIEMRLNNQLTTEAIKSNAQTIAIWSNLVARGHQMVGVCGPSNEAVYKALLAEAAQNYRDATPTFGSSAWESAVSSGTLMYFESGQARRFADYYSALHGYSSATSNLLAGGINNASEMASLLHERTLDCAGAARALDWHLRMLQVVQSNLDSEHRVLENSNLRSS